MFIVIGVLLVLIGMILIWFHVPYSPVKKDFQNDIDTLISENQLRTNNEVFTEEDFSSLPVVIQKYIHHVFVDFKRNDAVYVLYQLGCIRNCRHNGYLCSGDGNAVFSA